MISVEDLTKNYGPFRAVDHASFSVAPGETIGFLGPNGAGKTTTMRLMTGLFPPSSGDILIDGYSILTHPRQVKERIGYLPESSPVYLDMSVDSYLKFVAEIKGVASRNRAEQVDKVVSECSLEDVRTKLARKLSKGYRQRLGLAQALIADPPVIILDEPTAGLDPTQTYEFRNLIQGLKGQRTIILSSHILPEVSMICDRVVIISKGKIIAQDTPENLSRTLNTHTEYLVSLDTDANTAADSLSGIAGVIKVQNEKRAGQAGTQFRLRTLPDSDPREELVRTIVANGWKLLELSVVHAGLEDVFLNLVTEEGDDV